MGSAAVWSRGFGRMLMVVLSVVWRSWRLNAATTSSGALWWQGHPETVLPYVKGWVTAITSNQFPVFSSAATNWNERAQASALHKGGVGVDAEHAPN